MPIEGPSNGAAAGHPSRIVSSARYRQLFSQLDRLDKALTSAVKDENAPAIRGGLVAVMHAVQEAFEPYLNGQSLLSVRLITEALVAVDDGHKHWLTAEPEDGQYSWRKSPYSRHLQACGAAMLEAFAGNGVPEEKLCKIIADTLLAGGYGRRSTRDSAPKRFGNSTIRSWRTALTDGSPQPDWLTKEYLQMRDYLLHSGITLDEAMEQLRDIARTNAPMWVTPQRKGTGA